MYPPCEDEVDGYGSVTSTITWPEIDPTDLIESPYDKNMPAAVVEVDEAYVAYVE
jgi:hypothetical protein